MAVIFPDIELLVIDYLVAALADRNISGVRVGTKKLPAEAEQPENGEVVVIGNYTGTLDAVRQEATLTIECYSDDYAAANELGLIVGALIVEMPSPVKRAVVVMGPVRLVEESTQEKRSLSVELVVKGSDF